MYNYKYCPLCSNELVEKIPDNEELVRKVCEKCGFIWYNNPVPACGVFVTDSEGRILLGKRKYPPEVGGWTLPAGFMEQGEGPDECAVREAQEETGLNVKITGLMNAYKAGDDPRTKVVLIIYFADIVSGELRAGDDVAEVGWFHIDKLPDFIAFSAHKKALKEYREKYLEK
ncbi:MAG: NUDIX domain-containing protein [candidate division Zixibacteria bacterium]|nr:NUDIX domain-containing protein [candidate division Zixibacteria bacterium]